MFKRALRYALGLAERTGMTFAQAFVAALALAGALDLSTARAAGMAAVAAALTVPIGAIHNWLATNAQLGGFWTDLTARTAATFVETFLGALIATGTVDLSTAHAAALAGLSAALAAAKALIAKRIGDPATAAALPRKLDPGYALAA